MSQELRAIARKIPVVRHDIHAELLSRRKDAKGDLAPRRTALEGVGHGEPGYPLAQGVLAIMDAHLTQPWDEVGLAAILDLRRQHCAIAPDITAVADLVIHDARYLMQASLSLPDARRQIRDMLALAPAESPDVAQALQAAGDELAPENPCENALNRVLDTLAALQATLPPPVRPTDGATQPRLGAIEQVLIVEDDIKWWAWAEEAVRRVTEDLGTTVAVYHCTDDLRRELEANRPSGDEPWRLLLVLDLALPRKHSSGEVDVNDYRPPSQRDDGEPNAENTKGVLQGLFPEGEGRPPIIALTTHAELRDAFSPWVDRRNYVTKDVISKDEQRSLDELDLTRDAMEARVRDHIEPLKASQCELRLLDFSGCQVVFNGVQVKLGHREYGTLRLLAGRDVRTASLPVAMDDLLKGALLSEHFEVKPDLDDFWNDPFAYLTGYARAAESRVRSTVPADLCPADPLVFALDLPDSRTLSLACPSEVIADPYYLLCERPPFRALIVEDMEAERDFLLECLKGEFDEVVAVANGDELRSALARQQFAAAVLDLEFPEHDHDDLSGPHVGTDWHRRLLEDRALRYIVVYSRHDTAAIRGSLDKTFQRVASREWREPEKLTHPDIAARQETVGGIFPEWNRLAAPPGIVPKRGRPTEELGVIVSHLARAQWDYQRRARSADVADVPALPQIALPSSSALTRRIAPRSKEDLWERCTFLLDGQRCAPAVPRSLPVSGHGYNVLYWLACAPRSSFSGLWLAERLIADGVLELPDDDRLNEQWLTWAVRAIRDGMDALTSGLGQRLITEEDEAYCLNARAVFLDDDEWQARLEEVRPDDDQQ